MHDVLVEQVASVYWERQLANALLQRRLNRGVLIAGCCLTLRDEAGSCHFSQLRVRFPLAQHESNEMEGGGVDATYTAIRLDVERHIPRQNRICLRVLFRDPKPLQCRSAEVLVDEFSFLAHQGALAKPASLGITGNNRPDGTDDR